MVTPNTGAATAQRKDFATRAHLGQSAKPKAEGPAITQEERQAFLNAAKHYDKTPEGSEERVSAVRVLYPILVRGYKSKINSENLNEDDQRFLLVVAKKMERIVEELSAGCSSSDYHMRQLSFKVMCEFNLIRKIAGLAKSNEYDDVNSAAVQHIVDSIAVKCLVDATAPKYAAVDGKKIPIKDYYRGLLLDIAISGTFGKPRDQVVEHFSNGGERARLAHIAEKSMFIDTKRRALRAMQSMRAESNETERFAEEFIQLAFPGAVKKPEPPPTSVAVVAQKAVEADVREPGKVVTFLRKVANDMVPEPEYGEAAATG